MLTRFTKRQGSSVRSIAPEWAPECALLHAQAFAHPWSEFEFERLLAADNTIADGAFDADGKLLQGFVLSRRAADEAEILTVVVDPAIRRRGVGRALIGAHLARLGGLAIGRLFLEVEEQNRAALALYGHYGFHEVGRRRGYYPKASGEAATALVLRRDIE